MSVHMAMITLIASCSLCNKSAQHRLQRTGGVGLRLGFPLESTLGGYILITVAMGIFQISDVNIRSMP